MDDHGRTPGLIIACGGTGGHLFPGLAVAEEWTARGGRVLILVSEKEIDREASRKYVDFKFASVPAMAKPPTLSLRMLPFLAKLWKTVRSCDGMIADFQPVAVLGMGGFTSLPPIYAAKRRAVPAFIHDSNALPGKANRLTSRWCRQVFIGFDEARSYFPNVSCVVTGTPVRKELTQLPSRDDAAQQLGLDPARPVVLVMGGSQGAKRLNSLVAETAFPSGSQVLHIAGPGDHQRIKNQAGNRSDYQVLGFCDDMAAAYAVADVVIARAGASSMTELAYLGLPSILVPYPYAADDHQTKNAEVFAAAGAGFLEQEDSLDATKLAARVALVLEPATREEIRAALEKISVRNAAERVCKAIEEAIA